MATLSLTTLLSWMGFPRAFTKILRISACIGRNYSHFLGVMLLHDPGRERVAVSYTAFCFSFLHFTRCTFWYVLISYPSSKEPRMACRDLSPLYPQQDRLGCEKLEWLKGPWASRLQTLVSPAHVQHSNHYTMLAVIIYADSVIYLCLSP